MNRILYITKHNPWGIGGGSVASRMYLEGFTKLFYNYSIDLCIADSIQKTSIPTKFISNQNIKIHYIPARKMISKLLSPLTGITHRYQKIGKKLLKDHKYKYVIFDHSSIAGTLINYVPDDSKTIVIHHNFEPDYFKDNTKYCIKRNLLLYSVKKCEQEAYLKSSFNIFLTEEDRVKFEEMYGLTNSKNIICGLFETLDSKSCAHSIDLKRNNPTIAITGSLNNVQNIDGIRYFIDCLYPLVPPRYKVIIAGRNPTAEVYKLLEGKNNIELVPNPIDMQSILQKSSIFLSPARLGGGIKVRVTDGLRSGLPVIAHTVSSRGYGAYIKKGYLKVFSNPDEFKSCLSSLVEEIDKNKIKSDSISGFYKQNNSFEIGLLKLKTIL